MTEDEAKTKWCPFARSIVEDAENAAGNRWVGDEHGEANNCIGSACMAWRTMARSTGVMTTTLDGFCGLAGSPQ